MSIVYIWDTPGAKDRFKQQKAEYWSVPENREKKSREVRQWHANKPDYARNMSDVKKRYYRENPEAARRHSERMKKRFAQNPRLKGELSERLLRNYRDDPILKVRMAQRRKKYYRQNPSARARVGAIARDRAAQRRALRGELLLLAEAYKSKTGESFAIPSRSEGGWKGAVMVELIERLKRSMNSPTT